MLSIRGWLRPKARRALALSDLNWRRALWRKPRLAAPAVRTTLPTSRSSWPPTTPAGSPATHSSRLADCAKRETQDSGLWTQDRWLVKYPPQLRPPSVNLTGHL